MKQYRVQITDSALQDMEMIYIYIAEQLLAPDYAMGQMIASQKLSKAFSSFQSACGSWTLLRKGPWGSGE